MYGCARDVIGPTVCEIEKKINMTKCNMHSVQRTGLKTLVAPLFYFMKKEQ